MILQKALHRIEFLFDPCSDDFARYSAGFDNGFQNGIYDSVLDSMVLDAVDALTEVNFDVFREPVSKAFHGHFQVGVTFGQLADNVQ